MIDDIIKTLNTISENKDNQPLYILGGYIVGATIARDDIDKLYEAYPGLEIIAELGADLETLEDDKLSRPIFKEFQNALSHLQRTLQKS